MKQWISTILVCLLLVAMPVGVLAETAADEAMRQEMSDAWLTLYGKPINWDGTAKYYGTVADYGIFFDLTPTTAEMTITVAGYGFQYISGFQIYVYGDGAFHLLQDAFETGLLTAEDVGQIYNIHIGLGNPQNGDPILMTVAMLLFCGTGTAVLISRRKDR